MHSDVVDTKEQIQSEHSGSSDDIVEEGKGRKTIENLRNSSSADCERETSQARVDAGSLDDKSIVKRAYDLIDRTAQKIRRSPATYHEEIDHYHVGAAHETELQAGPQGLAPVAARANAKAASAYFTGGRDKRREPSEPGAEYVRSRAPGLESTFYLRLFRNHNFVRTVSETERQHQPAETEETAESLSQIEALKRLNLKNIRCKRLRKCSWFLAIVAVCILVAVGTAIGIKVGKARQSKTQPTGRKGPTPSSPFTLDCNELKSQMQPNAMSQCNCTKEIIVVAPDIVERYNNLTESFIHTIFPLFDETLNSCNPQNQALVWLASDEGTTTDLRQRYTYALLFTLWNGPGWAKRDKWLSSDDECTWYGLDCNDQGEVINITFTSNNVLVDLPPVAALLSNVESLNIMLNNFQGNTIPTEVGLLSNLTTLVMDLTETKGTLPTELFELGATLQNFQATDNFLSGTIPTLIGKLTLLGKCRSFLILY